jgi:hypothetical protein
MTAKTPRWQALIGRASLTKPGRATTATIMMRGNRHASARTRHVLQRAAGRLMSRRPSARHPGRGSWEASYPDAPYRDGWQRDGLGDDRDRAAGVYRQHAAEDHRDGAGGGTGVMLAVTGPAGRAWLLLQSASFVLWFGAMTGHVLGYIWRLPRLARGDLTGRAGRRANEVLAGRGNRWLLPMDSIVTGLLLAVLTVHQAGAWTGLSGLGH